MDLFSSRPLPPPVPSLSFGEAEKGFHQIRGEFSSLPPILPFPSAVQSWSLRLRALRVFVVSFSCLGNRRISPLLTLWPGDPGRATGSPLDDLSEAAVTQILLAIFLELVPIPKPEFVSFPHDRHACPNSCFPGPPKRHFPFTDFPTKTVSVGQSFFRMPFRCGGAPSWNGRVRFSVGCLGLCCHRAFCSRMDPLKFRSVPCFFFFSAIKVVAARLSCKRLFFFFLNFLAQDPLYPAPGLSHPSRLSHFPSVVVFWRLGFFNPGFTLRLSQVSHPPAFASSRRKSLCLPTWSFVAKSCFPIFLAPLIVVFWTTSQFRPLSPDSSSPCLNPLTDSFRGCPDSWVWAASSAGGPLGSVSGPSPPSVFVFWRRPRLGVGEHLSGRSLGYMSFTYSFPPESHFQYIFCSPPPGAILRGRFGATDRSPPYSTFRRPLADSFPGFLFF